MNILNLTNKSYDINFKIDNEVRKCCRKYIKCTNVVDEYMNISMLKGVIKNIAEWYMKNFDTLKEALNKEELVDLALEDKELLMKHINIYQLKAQLLISLTYEQKELFVNNESFKRKMIYLSMLKIIELGGKDKGSEYALIFAKKYDLDYAPAMQYASYSGKITDERLKKFINIYLQLGGSKDVYWLPNYFKEKNRYDMEELEDVIRINNELSSTQKKYKKIKE